VTVPSATCAVSPDAAKISMASASGIATQQIATLKSALRAKFDQRIVSSFVKHALDAFPPSSIGVHLFQLSVSARFPRTNLKKA
jgi:hypothetical protein